MALSRWKDYCILIPLIIARRWCAFYKLNVTLIISVGNSENFIQVSDRRLSSNGRIADDNSGKNSVLITKNGRFAVGYTGLARFGGFETHEWLIRSLCNCGMPDFDSKNILERFCNKATEEFRTNKFLKNLNPVHKRLSIMVTGYLHHHDPPLGALALISNYENLETKEIKNNADDTFRVYFQTEHRPNPPRMKLFHSVGVDIGPKHVMNFNSVIDLAVDKKPSQAVVGKMISLIRNISLDQSYRNVVGKELDSIIIPCNPNEGFKCNYHPTTIHAETYFPAFICAIDNARNFATKDIAVEAIDGPSYSGPKLRPKQLCWCESGKIYKNCHGSKNPPGPNPSINYKIENRNLVVKLDWI